MSHAPSVFTQTLTLRSYARGYISTEPLPGFNCCETSHPPTASVHAHPPQFRYTTSTMQYMYPLQYTYPLLQTCPFQYTSSIPTAAYDNHQHIANQWVRGPEQFIPGEGITSSPPDDRIFRGVVLNTELPPGSCRNLQCWNRHCCGFRGG
jgi:hypothetical protein